jgi:hypothetical protein
MGQGAVTGLGCLPTFKTGIVRFIGACLRGVAILVCDCAAGIIFVSTRPLWAPRGSGLALLGLSHEGATTVCAGHGDMGRLDDMGWTHTLLATLFLDPRLLGSFHLCAAL